MHGPPQRAQKTILWSTSVSCAQIEEQKDGSLCLISWDGCCRSARTQRVAKWSGWLTHWGPEACRCRVSQSQKKQWGSLGGSSTVLCCLAMSPMATVGAIWHGIGVLDKYKSLSTASFWKALCQLGQLNWAFYIKWANLCIMFICNMKAGWQNTSAVPSSVGVRLTSLPIKSSAPDCKPTVRDLLFY